MSVEIESKIKPLVQEKKKDSTHSFTDMRACSFSHVGVTNLGLRLLKSILMIQKTELQEGDRVIINDVYNGNLFLVQLGRLQDCCQCILNH